MARNRSFSLDPTGAPRARPPGADRATYLFVVLMGTSFPLISFFRGAVDRARAETDTFGTTYMVSEGIVGDAAQAILTLGVVLAAAHIIYNAYTERRLTVSPWGLFALSLGFAEAVRPDREVGQILLALLAFLVLVAAGAARLDERMLAVVGGFSAIVAVTVIAYAALYPEQGWGECRPDKCSVAGSLLRGYFVQENVLGLYLAVVLPTLAYVRYSLGRLLSLVVVLGVIGMSGSRTAMVASVVGLWAYALLRRRVAPQCTLGDAGKIVGLLPLVWLLGSMVLVFVLSGRELTGRGSIYSIVRRGWQEAPLFGPGRDVLKDAYLSSSSNWYAAHEHSQAGYILAQGGLLGVFIAVVVFGSLAAACWRSGGPVPCLFAMAPSVAFFTEPVWEFSLTSFAFLTIVFTAAMQGHVRRGEVVPVPWGGRSSVHAEVSRGVTV